MGDKSQFDNEAARMLALNTLIQTAGRFEPWLFEDMVETTIDLLKALGKSVHNPQGMDNREAKASYYEWFSE
jgi:hypothetical protein